MVIASNQMERVMTTQTNNNNNNNRELTEALTETELDNVVGGFGLHFGSWKTRRG
jgi:hypothetical protein